MTLRQLISVINYRGIKKDNYRDKKELIQNPTSSNRRAGVQSQAEVQVCAVTTSSNQLFGIRLSIIPTYFEYH